MASCIYQILSFSASWLNPDENQEIGVLRSIRTMFCRFLTLAFSGDLGILVEFFADFLQSIPKFRVVFVGHLHADLGEAASFVSEWLVARFIQPGNQPLDVVLVGKSADYNGPVLLIGRHGNAFRIRVRVRARFIGISVFFLAERFGKFGRHIGRFRFGRRADVYPGRR